MWQIVGHERVIETLGRALGSGHLPHALLFTGLAGAGKTRLSIEMAKALNCTGADRPCQKCVHCRQIEAGTHPDITIVAPLDGKDSISIQQVRELREAASLRPFQGSQKVCIVAGAGSLTLQAADALLKTLEEPQPHLTMILTAPEIDALPGTVVSRCAVVHLGPVDIPTIAQAVEKLDVSQQDAERISRLARGSVGWALRAAKQPKVVAQQEEMVKQLCSILDLGLDARLQLAESLCTERKDRSAIRRTLELMALLARDVLLLKFDLPPLLVSGEKRDMLHAQATRSSLARIHAYLQGLRVVMKRIDQNVDPRLALEALMVSIP